MMMIKNENGTYDIIDNENRPILRTDNKQVCYIINACIDDMKYQEYKLDNMTISELQTVISAIEYTEQNAIVNCALETALLSYKLYALRQYARQIETAQTETAQTETAQTETAQTETAQTETAKAKTINAVNDYLDYANGFDCHITPTKTIHSGKDGNAFEMLVKLALGNYRFNGIALKGRTDTTKKINGNMVKFEIKQGCSELGFINELGEKHITVLDKDIIIYMPTYTLNMDINNAYVMDTNAFINMLADLNLIRYKKSSAMCKRPKEQQYKDRIAIQSFSNSIKKETALYNALETNAIKLKDFIAQYGIKSIAL